uniref:Uncharacterized protein n=1 Tax=Panagrolaimus sp. ES5 TaxID=591445 RepID=A0AC34FVL5_9BILA
MKSLLFSFTICVVLCCVAAGPDRRGEINCNLENIKSKLLGPSGGNGVTEDPFSGEMTLPPCRNHRRPLCRNPWSSSESNAELLPWKPQGRPVKLENYRVKRLDDSVL